MSENPYEPDVKPPMGWLYAGQIFATKEAADFHCQIEEGTKRAREIDEFLNHSEEEKALAKSEEFLAEYWRLCEQYKLQLEGAIGGNVCVVYYELGSLRATDEAENWL